MDEQDLEMRKKIEKREKFDIFLAYLLIVILLGCIAIVVYLKFFKDDSNKPEEYTPNYITLNDISERMNSSVLANNYTKDGATFNSSVSDNSIVVNYVKGDNNTTLIIPLVNNELEINLKEDIAKDIYKEIGNIICVFYGNEEASCRATIDGISSDNAVDGIRFVTSGDSNFVYINITKGVETSTAVSNSDEKVYTVETSVGVEEKNYKLNIKNTEISNINITNTDTSFLVGGTITSNNENDVLTVNVKLYDESDKVIGENKKEYAKDSSLNKSDDFVIEFKLDDNLKLDSIKKYSINVVR